MKNIVVIGGGTMGNGIAHTAAASGLDVWLVDVSEPHWRERIERLLTEVTDLVGALGGTVAGEHGDGRIRTPLLGRVFSAERMAEFDVIKRQYDPEGRMNPGVKVRGLPGIGDIKYDPALVAHPETVRRALRHVEHARAYAEFRLDLI